MLSRTLILALLLAITFLHSGNAASQGRSGGIVSEPSTPVGRAGSSGPVQPRAGGTAPAEEEGEEREQNGSVNTRQTRGQKFLTEGEIGFGVLAAIGLTLTVGAAGALTVWKIKSRQEIDREPLSVGELTSLRTADCTAQAESKEADTVEITAFAPPVAKERAKIFVQIFLHKIEAQRDVESFAESIDPTTSVRGKASLVTAIRRNDRLDIILEGPSNAVIDEPHQCLVWRGEARACQFVVTLPSVQEGSRALHFRVRIVLDSVPIGYLAFPLTVSVVNEAPAAELLSGDAHRPRHAFLSYASTDRAEVLKRAQALRLAKIDFFQDLLSLDPGERWEQRLYTEIDRCDLFLLFWSSTAAHSQWVMRETQHALQRQKLFGVSAINIVPVVLEGPPVPPPPDELKDIHFNDSISYVISAVDAEQRALQRGPSERALRKREKRKSINSKAEGRVGEDSIPPRWIGHLQQVGNFFSSFWS